jgi:hypothetical protein
MHRAVRWARKCRFVGLCLVGMLSLDLGGPGAAAAHADPSGRVAYLSDSRGDVSYSPAGEDDWLQVERNRPVIRGDRVWTDAGARAELQVGGAVLRLGSNTSLRLLELNDGIAHIEMTEGTLYLRIRRLYAGQTYEVATPNMVFTFRRAGRYRIDVDASSDDGTYDDSGSSGGETHVVVWEGAGEVQGEDERFPLRAGDAIRFYSDDLRDYDDEALPPRDAIDRYCLERDRRLDRSLARRYVNDDMVGYSELDTYGDWRAVREYGSVWFPRRVDVGWAPYRDGNWVWQEPWGWTWIDAAPWGFAPSHYGRWVHVSDRWGWVPGPRNLRPVYAPALVAFIGGGGWSLSVAVGSRSPVGWFPLAPREVYVPSYRVSRDYFNRVNVHNTVVNTTSITNIYNNYNGNYASGDINIGRAAYRNRQVPGAVTAVTSDVFTNAQPVRRAAIRLDRNALNTGSVRRLAPVVPSERSVLGRSAKAGARPDREALERHVVVRTAPPPAERSFSERQPELQRHPGRPAVERAREAAQQRESVGQRNIRLVPSRQGVPDARAAGSRRAAREPADRVLGAGAVQRQRAPDLQERQLQDTPSERPSQLQRREQGNAEHAAQQQQQQQQQRQEQAAQQEQQLQRRRQEAARQRQREQQEPEQGRQHQRQEAEQQRQHEQQRERTRRQQDDKAAPAREPVPAAEAGTAQSPANAGSADRREAAREQAERGRKERAARDSREKPAHPPRGR